MVILHQITAAQCRAARALLEMTQGQLAEQAGCGLSTVVDFEKSRREVSAAAVRGIQKALEQAGIEFLTRGRKGVGVCLRGD